MHCATCPQVISLSRPWPLQAWHSLSDHLADRIARWRAVWRQRASRTRLLRAAAAAADLDQRVLSDIGAPDWLQAESRLRASGRGLERDLLSQQMQGSQGRMFY